jgi:hypothetical protein
MSNVERGHAIRALVWLTEGSDFSERKNEVPTNGHEIAQESVTPFQHGYQ